MKINPCSRDRPFFDQYQYVLSFRLRNVNCLRGLNKIRDMTEAHEIVSTRFEYRNKVRNHGGNWAIPDADVGKAQQQNLHALLDKLIEKCENGHLTVTSDYAYVYSNDLDWLKEIAELPYLSFVKLREAVVNRPRDTVLLSNTSHTRRSYFRDCWITTETKVILRSFLNNQENIRLCSSLSTWLNKEQTGKYNGKALLARHYFFDHNSDAIPFMLSLAAPKIIRCTIKVLAK